MRSRVLRGTRAVEVLCGKRVQIEAEKRAVDAINTARDRRAAVAFRALHAWMRLGGEPEPLVTVSKPNADAYGGRQIIVDGHVMGHVYRSWGVFYCGTIHVGPSFYASSDGHTDPSSAAVGAMRAAGERELP